MIKKSFLFISLIVALSINGCIKDSYNLNLLSKQAQLSPTLAISAAKGNISLSDIVKTNDTVLFDQNNLVILVFKKDSLVNLTMDDFSKGVQKTATIEPGSFNLNINQVLNHITGTFHILNPTLKFNYSNSFPDSLTVNLIASAIGKSKTSRSESVPVCP